jgi:SNF2 family DNA or RNA helicase
LYFGGELKPFQVEGVEYLKDQRSRLVGDDPGLGKTYTGIALDLAAREKLPTLSRKAKTLIICPMSVIGSWDEHCMKLTDLDVTIIDDRGQPAAQRARFLKKVLDPERGGYFICHWEALRALVPKMRHIKWVHVIADECHRGKNRKAQQTQALWKIKTMYKTAMSGTPADNKPQDLWGILHWLWPKYYHAYWPFVKTYVEYERDDDAGYYKLGGPNKETLPRLHQEMRPWYIRRRKKDVLPDLPDKYYTRMWVSLSPKQRAAYDSMKKTMVTWIEDHREGLEKGDPMVTNAAVVQLIRLQQFSDGYMIPEIDPVTGKQKIKIRWPKGYPTEEKAKYLADPDRHEFDVPQWEMTDPSTKLDLLCDMIYDRGEQIVVFSQFKSVINHLAYRLDNPPRGKEKISYGLLTGAVKQSDRTKNVQAFQSGEIRVFAGTVAAGGVGITLTAASTVVFIDRSWSPSINLQAEDRLHRIGQEEAVEVIDIMGKNTVDLGKHQQLQKKAGWLAMMLGDTVDADLIIDNIDADLMFHFNDDDIEEY